MTKPSLSDLTAFVAIAEHRSFRKAADALDLSPSTLSHLVRTLETRLGVRLLHRTTRSVSPTEAGSRLLARLRPVLRDFDLALEEVSAFRGAPAGTLRINANETAARVLLASVVPEFVKRYPDVSLDLVTEGRLVDIVAEGFDAGVRLGEAVPQDMIATAIGGDVRFVAVASPAYLAARGAPETPDALKEHACIRHRLPSGKLYRWEFERRGQVLTVDVPGALTLDHAGLMADAAADGLGVAYMAEHSARAHLDAGRLHTVLDDWLPPILGLFLYYPGHRQPPSALRALIDLLKKNHGRRGAEGDQTGSSSATSPLRR